MSELIVEELRWAAFDRLRTNHSATPADLSADLNCSLEAIADILTAQSAIGRIEIDDAGAVIGAHGLTLLPTSHTLSIGDAELHTWCAFDAVGIPAAAGDDAQVDTTCGWCDQPLTVRVFAGTPVDDGDGVVLWLPTGRCDNVRQQFCPHANLFCDRDHLDRWRGQAGKPVGRVLTLAEAAQLGRQSWSRDTQRWGTGIEPLESPADVGRATCSCCGEARDRLVPLLCHDDIQICPVCISWLRGRSGLLDVTPILPVLDMPAAISFYETAGFAVREYEAGGTYAFVSHDDDSVFDLDVAEHPLDPATNGAGCYVIVPDVDDWHSRLADAALPVTAPVDQPWGMREFTLTDPSGNHLRIGQPVPADPASEGCPG